MTTEILIGIASIAIGIYIFYNSYKNPDSQLTNINFKGYAGGIGLVLVGIMFIIGKIKL